MGLATQEKLLADFLIGRKNLTPTQNSYLFQGLLVALQNATPRSLIVVFTDNGSKDLDLEKEIIRPVTNYKKV